jgi:hypothetical protein
MAGQPTYISGHLQKSMRGYFAELKDGVSEHAGSGSECRFGKRVKRYDCRSGRVDLDNYF